MLLPPWARTHRKTTTSVPCGARPASTCRRQRSLLVASAARSLAPAACSFLPTVALTAERRFSENSLRRFSCSSRDNDETIVAGPPPCQVMMREVKPVAGGRSSSPTSTSTCLASSSASNSSHGSDGMMSSEGTALTQNAAGARTQRCTPGRPSAAWGLRNVRHALHGEINARRSAFSIANHSSRSALRPRRLRVFCIFRSLFDLGTTHDVCTCTCIAILQYCNTNEQQTQKPQRAAACVCEKRVQPVTSL